MKEQQQNWRKGLAGKDYRKFLATFKTQPCYILQSHFTESCQYFHSHLQQNYETSQQTNNNQYFLSLQDRRRNPYGRLNQFLYCEKMCPQLGQCIDEECQYCHNAWQYNYHPLNFKTVNCENIYDCGYAYCYKIHFKEYIINQKTQTYIINFSEFFRFDLNTFKTKPCPKQYSHDKSFCLFYHSAMDYRRPNFEIYQHTECPYMNNEGCKNPNCCYSHNKIQQLYHPRRYKSKFCENHYNSRRNAANPDDETSFKSMCPFGKLCSFAHNNEEITIDLIDKAPKNLQFYLYMYKTVWCPITTDHNRSQCVYAHNIQDFRRSPKQKYYEPIQCPFWKKNQNIKCIEEAGCPAGMDCDKCHGWKQKQYHPVIYCKTKANNTEKNMKTKDVKNKEKSDSYFSSEVKSKTDSSYAKESNQKQLRNQVVSKKLGTGVKNNTKIQAIVQQHLKKGKNYQQKTNIYSPGTPFFKNNQLAAKKKTKSQHGQTKKQQIQDKMSQMEERGSLATTKSIQLNKGVPYLNFVPDQSGDADLFKAFQSGNENTCDQKISSHHNIIHKNQSQGSSQGQKQHMPTLNSRVVSKSVGCKHEKSDSFYSKDTTELLSPTIVNILKENKISEIKLINMSENQVRKISQLSNSQKSLIINKIILTRDPQRKTPTYEDYLVKFFTKHKRQQTLQKLRNKKVKQERLFLLSGQIRQFSFLTESQKNQLPKLLKQLANNRDFDSLNDDIAKSINNEDISKGGVE